LFHSAVVFGFFKYVKENHLYLRTKKRKERCFGNIKERKRVNKSLST
jgi:hypothetical protein